MAEQTLDGSLALAVENAQENQIVNETSTVERTSVVKPGSICNICGKTITGNLSFHMALHPVDRPQICNLCIAVFRSKEELVAHFKEIHENDRQFMCESCGQAYSTKPRLVRHQRKHKDKAYKCVYCDHAFLNYDNWRHHEIRHRGVTHFKCDLCQIGFWDKTMFAEHQLASKCTKEIVCCGQTFTQRLEYAKHSLETHHKANLEEHACEFCNKLFPYASSKRNHINMMHYKTKSDRADSGKPNCLFGTESKNFKPKCNEDGMYTCEICDTSVKTLKGLKLHILKQHAPPDSEELKIHQCTMCDKKFITWAKLYQHKQTHIKRHVCTVCNKKFAHNFLLKNHMLTHEASAKPYPCKLCDKFFYTKLNLIAHESTHSDLRPYKCRFCDSRFKRRTAVRYHELIHTGERPFKCKICGAGFTQSSTCKAHEKTHEKVEGKRKFPCKDCNIEFWSVTQLKTHRQEEHEKANQIQIVTEDGQTHWIHPNDMKVGEDGNVYYIPSV